jgi:hypothetical protein
MRNEYLDACPCLIQDIHSTRADRTMLYQLISTDRNTQVLLDLL